MWAGPNQGRFTDQPGLSRQCILVKPNHAGVGSMGALLVDGWGLPIWPCPPGSRKALFWGSKGTAPPRELALSGGLLWGGVQKKSTPLGGTEIWKNTKW